MDRIVRGGRPADGGVFVSARRVGRRPTTPTREWPGKVRCPIDRRCRVRVEAAAYRGKPVSFHVVGPWTRETRANPEPDVQRRAGGQRRGHRHSPGRCWSRRCRSPGTISAPAGPIGAAPLASSLYMIVSGFALWLAGAHHVASADGEFKSLFLTAAIFTLIAVVDGHRLPRPRALRPPVLAGQPARLVAADRRSPPRPAGRTGCVDRSGIRRRAQLRRARQGPHPAAVRLSRAVTDVWVRRRCARGAGPAGGGYGSAPASTRWRRRC